MSVCEPEYFDCTCSSAEHVVRFWLDNDEVNDPLPPELCLEVQLCQWRCWWQRVWVAVKYICGYQCRYGHWDCWTLRPEDTARLERFLDIHQTDLAVWRQRNPDFEP